MTSKPGAKPQDRKQKNEGPSYETVDIEVGEGDNKKTIPARRTTVRDVELTIEERRLTDYRICKLLSQARRGALSASAEALELLVGEEQHEKIIAACADEDGFVSQEDIGEFITEMFRAIAPNS